MQLFLEDQNLVGKPMSQLLINANCTVTQVHSKTKDIQSFTSQADILVAAIGIPNFVKSDWVKKDAIIIDVGINRVESDQNATAKTKLVGDVDFEDVFDKVSAITPVPGGVGLMTVACLMNNTLIATKPSIVCKIYFFLLDKSFNLRELIFINPPASF